MLPTKVAGLAQKNLAFNILEAKLKEELHGKKMPRARGHLQGLCPPDKGRCGSKETGSHCTVGIKRLSGWRSNHEDVE